MRETVGNSRGGMTGRDAAERCNAKRALRSEWVRMFEKSGANSAGAIKYALTSRLQPEGRVAISLQLYKGRDVAHSRSLGAVEQHELVDVMFKCRMHLNRLGVERLSAPTAAPSRLPPAQTLKLKR